MMVDKARQGRRSHDFAEAILCDPPMTHRLSHTQAGIISIRRHLFSE